MSKRVESSMPTEPSARKNETSRSANPAVEIHQKTLGQGMPVTMVLGSDAR